MIRKIQFTARLAATILLIGAAVAACGRGQPARGWATETTPPPASSMATTAAEPTSAEPALSDTPASLPSEEASASPSTAASASAKASAAPTVDPLDIDLSQLQTLLTTIDGSISGSNGGGE